MTGAPARPSLCRRRHAWLIFQPRVVRPGWGLRIHSGSCDAIARLWRTDATSAASLGARAVEALAVVEPQQSHNRLAVTVSCARVGH